MLAISEWLISVGLLPLGALPTRHEATRHDASLRHGFGHCSDFERSAFLI